MANPQYPLHNTGGATNFFLTPLLENVHDIFKEVLNEDDDRSLTPKESAGVTGCRPHHIGNYMCFITMQTNCICMAYRSVLYYFSERTVDVAAK